MEKKLTMMRNIRNAQVSIKANLKEQEKINSELREQMTPIWENKEKAGIVADLAHELSTGKARVRAAQVALHELKRSLRIYNKQYDRKLKKAK